MTYAGGKNSGGAFHRIINEMPPHDFYLEPFLGSAAVMRAKLPATFNVGLDTDESAYKEAARLFKSAVARYRILNRSAFDFFASFDWQEGIRYFVYFDPPYLLQTRKQKQTHLYLHEFFYQDHERLLDIATTIPAMVAISSYWSDLYDQRLRGWRSIHWRQMTRGGTMATEYLWMNYPEPDALHDYRYLGDGFRERERIKKKKTRWKAKLEKMPRLERLAILAAIEETRADYSPAGSPEAASGAGKFGSAHAASDEALPTRTAALAKSGAWIQGDGFDDIAKSAGAGRHRQS